MTAVSTDAMKRVVRGATTSPATSAVAAHCEMQNGHRGGDAGPQRDPGRRLARGAEPHPGVPRLARLPPRLQVVAAREAVEAGLLGGDRLLDQLAGGELLVRGAVEEACRATYPPPMRSNRSGPGFARHSPG